MNELIKKINNFYTVVESWLSSIWDMFFSTTPANVSVKKMKSDGTIEIVQMPNRASMENDFDTWKGTIEPRLNSLENKKRVFEVQLLSRGGEAYTTYAGQHMEITDWFNANMSIGQTTWSGTPTHSTTSRELDPGDEAYEILPKFYPEDNPPFGGTNFTLGLEFKESRQGQLISRTIFELKRTGNNYSSHMSVRIVPGQEQSADHIPAVCIFSDDQDRTGDCFRLAYFPTNWQNDQEVSGILISKG